MIEDPQWLAERYVALWNESDRVARRQRIEALWAPDGLHVMGAWKARGYEALEQRVTGSYERSVRDRGNRFRALPGAAALHDSVTFFWQMLPAAGGEVRATGVGFLILDAAGRILTDYQFVLTSLPAMPNSPPVGA
jgi:hypothetical protein